MNLVGKRLPNINYLVRHLVISRSQCTYIGTVQKVHIPLARHILIISGANLGQPLNHPNDGSKAKVMVRMTR